MGGSNTKISGNLDDDIISVNKAIKSSLSEQDYKNINININKTYKTVGTVIDNLNGNKKFSLNRNFDMEDNEDIKLKHELNSYINDNNTLKNDFIKNIDEVRKNMDKNKNVIYKNITTNFLFLFIKIKNPENNKLVLMIIIYYKKIPIIAQVPHTPAS